MLGTKILEEKNSKFNGNVRVVKTFGLGTYIQVDGLTQSGGIVGSIWKSTIKRIKNKDIRKVLILGLGGGSVAGFVRKKWKEAEIVGVDIDPLIISFGEKYLSLKEWGIKSKIADALKFKIRPEGYDLIIIDVYKGSEFPEGFENEDFIRRIKAGLSKNGTAVFNRLYYGDKRPKAVKFGNKIQKIFTSVEWHYPEANLMFLCK